MTFGVFMVLDWWERLQKLDTFARKARTTRPLREDPRVFADTKNFEERGYLDRAQGGD